MRRTIVILMLPACFTEPPALDAEGTGGTDDTTLPTLSPSTDPGSSMATTLSGDSSGAAETSEATDSSGGTSDSGDGSGSTTTAWSTSGSDSDSGSTGPDWPHEYHDCYDGPIGESPRLCAGSCVIDEATDASACAPDCVAGDCEDLTGFPAACLTEVAMGLPPELCVIPCNGPGAACPEDMVCLGADSIATPEGAQLYVCMWW